ncbi:HD-GYP domain-containing protein [Rhodoferax aquaticus]|uniref:HD-GYP domain-containing protein n=1 Tax=Rhodoferax aquaticus TaxID=2527691 RepID=UPI001F3D8660|nr:HD domain-containing protein [Rhodoferax aquaticus]
MNTDNDYEDLLAQWSDLESGLGVILGNPSSTQEFAHRVVQYDRWMQGLLLRDPDVGLYLLFQLASNSPVGYSASHALVCAVLCHLIAADVGLQARERDSLVRAALTMNIAMTGLQDTLANQPEKPSPEQQDVIRMHAVKGAMMLTNLGVSDDSWLDIVSAHHTDAIDKLDPRSAPPAAKLTRILKLVDRYAAMISPRASRAGRSATESVRSILGSGAAKAEDIGHAMVRAIGLCPPGTYVRLENNEIAVVVRRSTDPKHPYVAIVSNARGEPLREPRLHNTAQYKPRIKLALAASSVRARPNHFLILKMGAKATQSF